MFRSSRRQFLQTLAGAPSALLVGPTLSRQWAQWFVPQTPSQVRSVCSETAQPLLNLVATVKALTATFYFSAITTPNGFFAALPAQFQRYLRATLDADWFHYRYLTEQKSASPTATTFYFPAQRFAAGHFADFLKTLDALETLSIALLLAATRRFGELNELVLAETLGQISAIDAEHRVIGRELAQDAPPAPNNLCFQPARFFCADEANALLTPFLQSGANTSAYPLPTSTTVTNAVGNSNVDQTVPPATTASCAESVVTILASAAVAEAIGITFYYGGIQAGFFAQLSQPQQWYLQAALDEERQHLNFLLQNGASAPPTQFFFPSTAFTDRATFLTLLEQLENLFIGAYLTAMQRFTQLGEPLLAEIAGQILGVEAEHRVLGRVISGQTLPNNLALARASFTCLSDAVAALQPFIAGDAQSTQPQTRPTEAEINGAVNRFGCALVAIANIPPNLYLPLITR